MRRKVLFAIESLAGGGAEKVLTTIIKNLDKTKFDVTVLTVVKTGVYIEEIEKYCKIISILPDYSELKSIISRIQYKIKYKSVYKKDLSNIYKKIVKEKYDVEIAFVEGFVTKLIASSNNPDSQKYAWLHTNMIVNPYADQYYKSIEEEKEYYHKFNKIFSVSSSVKDAFEKKFGREYRVEVQYNSVDSEEICRKASEECNENLMVCGECHFVTVGRLEEQKGYRRLLRVLKKLYEYNSNFCIEILGEGSQRQELERFVQENHLEHNIRLCGFKKNPYVYMKKADYFICSSYTEGFSTVATEALIVGIPILTVECAGMQELFGNFQCGEIVSNDDESLFIMLKKAVDRGYDMELFRQQAEERGKNFNLKTRIKEMENILNEESINHD